MATSVHPASPPPIGDPVALLTAWCENADKREKLNFHAVHYYEAVNRWLGCLVIAITVLLGAGIKAGTQFETNVLGSIPGWILGFVAFLAPVFSGLQTFLRLSETSQKHRNSAARHGAIKREIGELLALPLQGDALRKEVNAIRKKIDDTELNEPAIPTRLWKSFDGAQRASYL